MASTHEMPVVPPSQHDNQISPDIARYALGNKITLHPIENHWVKQRNESTGLMYNRHKYWCDKDLKYQWDIRLWYHDSDDMVLYLDLWFSNFSVPGGLPKMQMVGLTLELLIQPFWMGPTNCISDKVMLMLGFLRTTGLDLSGSTGDLPWWGGSYAILSLLHVYIFLFIAHRPVSVGLFFPRFPWWYLLLWPALFPQLRSSTKTFCVAVWCYVHFLLLD